MWEWTLILWTLIRLFFSLVEAQGAAQWVCDYCIDTLHHYHASRAMSQDKTGSGSERAERAERTVVNAQPGRRIQARPHFTP